MTELFTRKNRWTQMLPKRMAKKPMSAYRSNGDRLAAEKMTSESTSMTVVSSLKMSSFSSSGSSEGLKVVRNAT